MLMPYHGIDPLPKSFSLVRKWSVVRGYICSCNSKGGKRRGGTTGKHSVGRGRVSVGQRGIQRTSPKKQFYYCPPNRKESSSISSSNILMAELKYSKMCGQTLLKLHCIDIRRAVAMVLATHLLIRLGQQHQLVLNVLFTSDGTC